MTTPKPKKESNSDDITVTLIEDDVLKRFWLQCQENKEFCLVQPYNQVLPIGYKKHHELVQNFDVFEDDIWICTFPKSGIHIIASKGQNIRCNFKSSDINYSVYFRKFCDSKNSKD